ncbi:hypothetical protein VNO77_33520 [Canavalia gladiata]|uniref:Uncharacterized protein n=1 Tax=Canavalia gladiata TaxID=3824 RepID=A0AAN9Q0U9_CANGL
MKFIFIFNLYSVLSFRLALSDINFYLPPKEDFGKVFIQASQREPILETFFHSEFSKTKLKHVGCCFAHGPNSNLINLAVAILGLFITDAILRPINNIPFEDSKKMNPRINSMMAIMKRTHNTLVNPIFSMLPLRSMEQNDVKKKNSCYETPNISCPACDKLLYILAVWKLELVQKKVLKFQIQTILRCVGYFEPSLDKA